MRAYVPSYYSRFRCIAGACRHSCCVGWEIDIDEETCALYRTMEGELGRRVRDSLVTEEGVTCFGLTAGERCPHLNADGLCEIILGAGEDYLSQICYDHPRFRSWFSDRVEVGLGLSCEEAARLVLTWEAPVFYVVTEDDGEVETLTPVEREVLAARERYIGVAQDRTLTVEERLRRLAEAAGVSLPSLVQWAEFTRGLERLDPLWGEYLLAFAEQNAECYGEESPSFLAGPSEQFLVYLLQRHLPQATDVEEIRLYVAFACLSCRLVTAVCAVRGEMTVEGFIDTVRLWSGEIEYSTENVASCITYLANLTKK